MAAKAQQRESLTAHGLLDERELPQLWNAKGVVQPGGERFDSAVAAGSVEGIRDPARRQPGGRPPVSGRVRGADGGG